MLNDEHWSKLREIFLHKTIYNKRDLRITVEGMLYAHALLRVLWALPKAA